MPHWHCYRLKTTKTSCNVCVWKPLKSHATSFIPCGNLFSGSFQSQQKLIKNTRIKMWNLFVKLERFVLSFKSPLKKSMSLTDELFKFAALLLTTWPAVQYTRSLQALVVIIQSLFLARSLRAGSFNLWSRHHCRMLQHLCTASSL